MDIYDPNQWTVEFAKQKGAFCISFLKETNAKVIEKLREGNYKAAAAGIDRMLNGAVTLHNTGDYDMRPFLSTYSFNQGIITVCGITDAPEQQRRQTAISSFSDARDFSTASLREISIGVINMLQSGQSLLSIKTEICPNFPSEIIGVMADTGRIDGAAVKAAPAAPAVGGTGAVSPSAQNGGGKKSGALKIVLAVIIPIAAVGLIVFGYWLSGFINDTSSSSGGSRKERSSSVREADDSDPDGGKNESGKKETSSYTNSGNNSSAAVSSNTSSAPKPAGRETTTYHVSTTSGLRLRYGPSLDNGIILEMPYLSTVEVYSIDGEWAYACYNGTDGYCSAEYISPGPGN